MCSLFCADDEVSVEIPIDSNTECCKLSTKSYIFASHEDLQLTFDTESGKSLLLAGTLLRIG